MTAYTIYQVLIFSSNCMSIEVPLDILVKWQVELVEKGNELAEMLYKIYENVSHLEWVIELQNNHQQC